MCDPIGANPFAKVVVDASKSHRDLSAESLLINFEKTFGQRRLNPLLGLHCAFVNTLLSFAIYSTSFIPFSLPLKRQLVPLGSSPDAGPSLESSIHLMIAIAAPQ